MSQKKSPEKFVEHEVQALLEIENFIASNPDPRELKRAGSPELMVISLSNQKSKLIRDS